MTFQQLTLPLATLLDELSAAFRQSELTKIAMAGPTAEYGDFYSRDLMAYGSVKTAEKLVIPEYMIPKFMASKWKRNNELVTPMDFLAISYWNYRALTAASVNPEHALFVAFYRAKLCAMGYLSFQEKLRCISETEVVVMQVPEDPFLAQSLMGNEAYRKLMSYDIKDMWDPSFLMALTMHVDQYFEDTDFKEFILSCSDEQAATTLQHVSKMAEQFAAITYLAFRKVGTAPNMVSLCTSYLSQLEAPMITSYPGHYLLFKTAVHSFGINAFHVQYYLSLQNCSLDPSLIALRNVIPAGVDDFEAAYNVWRAVSELPKASEFYTENRPVICKIVDIHKDMVGDRAKSGIKYHENASLFGVKRELIKRDALLSFMLAAQEHIRSLDRLDAEESHEGLLKILDKDPGRICAVKFVIAKTISRIQSESMAEDEQYFAHALEAQEFASERTAIKENGERGSDDGE